MPDDIENEVSTDDEILSNIGESDEPSTTDETDSEESSETDNEAAPKANASGREPTDGSTPNEQQRKAAGPQDLVDAKGNVIAAGGKERRFYETAQKEKLRADTISKELETVQARLAAMESAGSVGTQYNLTPEEVTTGAQIIAAYKQNPVETLQYMLTQAQAAGHNIDGLNAGGSMDMNAVRQMVENAVKPLMTEHQQRQDTQQTNARAQEIYDNFVTRFPDAPLHENSIARLLQSDSSLTPEAAYYKLQAFYAQKGLDWNKSLEVLQQEHNARGNVSERTQVPDGGGNNINVANTDRAVSLNTSTADIIRQAMAEAGIT